MDKITDKDSQTIAPASRLSAQLMCAALRRARTQLRNSDEALLTAVFEAVRTAQAAGSMCVGKARFAEAIEQYAQQLGLDAELDLNTAVNRMLEMDCVRVHETDEDNVVYPMPFVADAQINEDGDSEVVRLYVERSFFEEMRLADKMVRLSKLEASTTGDDEIVARAKAHRLSVVSGGPGTGKTSAVVRILYALLLEQPDAVIFLAAPTGKAAGRMQQAIAQGARRLGDGPIIAHLEQLKAQTIHRMLLTSTDEGKRPGPDTPLSCDILIIDESSMIDSILATRLFAAIDAERTRVVLLGDRHQLAAVGPGSVFADLSESAGPLAPCVTHLMKSYRFAEDKAIGRISRAINAGDCEQTLALLRAYGQQADGQDNAVHWHEESAPSSRLGLTAQAKAWMRRMTEEMIESIRACAGSPEAISQTMARYGILCAHRTGPMSLEAVNGYVDHVLSQAGITGNDWRPIIVRSNDEALQLYNGDIGLILPKEGEAEQEVFFSDFKGSGRRVKLGLLPPFDLAFAITIHQSQGSEYHKVAVLMPAKVDSGLATRELLYTAVTRVHDLVESDGTRQYGSLDIFSSQEVLMHSVREPVRRESGLTRRLEELIEVQEKTL